MSRTIVRIVIELPPELAAWLDRWREFGYSSRSDMIRTLLEKTRQLRTSASEARYARNS